MLDDVWVQQWFAAEKGETCGTQAVRPERIVDISLLDGWYCSGEMMIRVVAALLARKVAAVGQMIFQRRQFDHRWVAVWVGIAGRAHW